MIMIQNKGTILLAILFFSLGLTAYCQKDITTKNIVDFVVDKKATPETLALFYNLKKLSKTNIALGQQDAFNGFYFNIGGKSDIKKTTGFDPAVLGLDFAFITDDKNTGKADNWFFQQEQKTIADVQKAYSQGMIITFCWHFKEPYKGEAFYAEKMTDLQKNSVSSILPNGEKNAYFNKKLDKIADFAKNLKGKKGEAIPFIFRPFHEFDGNWFWWGKPFCTAEEYKQLYAYTVNYLKEVKGVHNLLFAFSPDNQFNSNEDYLERYPGDEFVDVLGMDDYGNFDNKGDQGSKKSNANLKIISDLAKEKNKIAALTETGYQITFTKNPIDNFFSKYIYNALTANDIEIAYVMFWTNNAEGYFVPQPNMPDTNDFIDFSKKPKLILQNQLPNMYVLDKK
jgi:mannan endo-1,4-beta-mannosidase